MKANIDLISKGYSVIPSNPSTKIPCIKNWTEFCTRLPNSQEVALWSTKGDYNASLALGECSGIVALDLDYNIDGLHEKILKLSGNSPIKKVGKKGITLLFRYHGEKNKTWKKDGLVVAELLSHKRNTVIPPSIHPETKQPYIWDGKDTLHTIDKEAIPFLPDDFILGMDMLFNNKDCDIVEIRKALEYIDSNDYSTWIRIGMALKTDLGDSALPLYDNWSAKAKSYTDVEQVKLKWDSFKSDGNVGLGTIFFLAIMGGYVPPKDKVTIDYLANVTGAIDELEDWRVNGVKTGTPCRLGALKEMLEFRQEGFTVVTGYPSAGKSEFTDALVLDLVGQDWKGIYCSMEKPFLPHLEALVHRVTKKPITDRGKEEQVNAVKYIADNLEFITSKFDLSLTIIEKIVSVVKRIKKLDLIVIDPFNFIVDDEGSGGADFRHVQKVCQACLKIAKKHNVHVILIAHPKNAETNKDGSIPLVGLNSIAGGSNFAAMADHVIAIDRTDNTNNVTIRVMKVRDQSRHRTGSARFKYDKLTKEYIPS